MPNSDYFPDPFPTDEVRHERAERTLWTTLGTLYRWRRFIMIVTGTAAVLAVVISLLLANWYRADTRLLLPPRTGTGLLSAAFMSNLPTAARSLLGGPSGDYFRYLSILSSRSVYESVVDTFDLVTVYELEEAEAPRYEAVEFLASNTEFLIDDEYEFLTVSVYDTDPERAAAMANYFIAQLSERNSRLAAQSARQFRIYVESRYDETVTALDSVQYAIQRFQERYGVLDLQQQGEQFFEFVADLRQEVLAQEAQYQMMLSQLGPENSQVQAMANAVAAANRKYQEALAGQERLLPVAKDLLPTVASEYITLERERVILATLLEYIRPVLEEARFDEGRQVEALQVIDRAVPPVEKARPRRSVICVAATLSAFLLAVLFVLVYTWWQRNHAYFAYRLRTAADDAPGEAPAAPRPPDVPEPSEPRPYATP